MKKTVLMLVMILIATTFTFAQTTADQEANKKEIKAPDLPREVRNAIGGSKYASWTLVKIYEITPTKPGEEKHFEVKVQKGEESVSMYYDIKGNSLDKAEH